MFCSGWLKMLFTGCATFRALLASSAFLGELPAVEAMLSEMCSSYSLVPLLLGPIFFWSGHLGRGNKFLGPVSLSHSCFTISIRCVDCNVAQLFLYSNGRLPRAHRQLWRFTIFWRSIFVSSRTKPGQERSSQQAQSLKAKPNQHCKLHFLLLLTRPPNLCHECRDFPAAE